MWATIFPTGSTTTTRRTTKGPLDRDFRHILSVSGLILLPERFQLGQVLTSVSKPPFSAFLGGLDLNGDGTTGDLLPGTTVNEFNRGLGKEDLPLLASQFNSIYARKRDAKGAAIRPIVLPSQFAFGDSFSTQEEPVNFAMVANRK
jgi:hypothetical protein